MTLPRFMSLCLRRRYSLAVCYLALALVYLAIFEQQIREAVKMPELLIAPIMAVGSFVAGSTFLGGGAVAFPALTKILNSDPETAKTFSLAIQSVGMTSASLYIISRVPALPIKFMVFYLCGAGAGLALSLWALQDIFTSADIRVGFTIFVLCFLIIYLWTHNNVTAHPEYKNDHGRFDHDKIIFTRASCALIIICGLLGGIISGLIGSGADLLAFCLLSLFFRIEIKLATQVSIIVMACSSLIGLILQISIFDDIPPQVVDLWYIAAPIVLFGAPLGAVFCKRTTTSSLVIFICAIVAVEVISTIWLVGIAGDRILFYFLGFATALVSLFLLFLQSPYHIEKSPAPRSISTTQADRGEDAD